MSDVPAYEAIACQILESAGSALEALSRLDATGASTHAVLSALVHRTAMTMNNPVAYVDAFHEILRRGIEQHIAAVPTTGGIQ